LRKWVNSMLRRIEKLKSSRKHTHIKINRSLSGNIFIFTLLAILGAFTALPLYLSIINSFKPLNELWVFPPAFYVLSPTIKNFIDLFTMMNNSVVPFSRYLFNTLFITFTGTLGQVVISSLCAYALAKHKYPYSNIIFKIIVLSLMFSPAVTAIPNYISMAALGWIDTYLAIIIPIFGSTLGLYLMKQFIEQMPDSILEAARIDGASEWSTFWKIVMPTVKPAWLTLVIFAVQNLWSMGPSTLIYSENLKTLNYALGQIISGGIARSGVATAIVVLMMSVPITVFVFTQSQVIETMSSSGIKE
jgi:ABC-type glycerol-3-phosphate transport system permease component